MILLSTITALSLLAGQINISSMPENPQRVNPTSADQILSFHDSIKDVKHSVVNISTTKMEDPSNQIKNWT